MVCICTSGCLSFYCFRVWQYLNGLWEVVDKGFSLAIDNLGVLRRTIEAVFGPSPILLSSLIINGKVIVLDAEEFSDTEELFSYFLSVLGL